ncbi:MAG: DUF3483 domain-containing protein [Alphaproteobacteria bacterium]
MTALLDILPGWLFGLGLAAGLVAAVTRARMWFAGRPAKVDVIGGLRALPARYLLDVHDVVARHPASARMHVVTAGGFLASIALIPVVHVLDVKDPGIIYALLLALAAACFGPFLDRRRFGRRRHAHLPHGPGTTAIGVGAFTAYFLFVTASDAGWFAEEPVHLAVAWLLIAFGGWGVVQVLALAPYRAMRHAFAGALHLAFHPRPGRFGADRPDVALEPLDLEAPKLGVEVPVDFTWNRLLGFDACVQCGRCELACPAFAAGQPLNPKKLIQDLVVGLSSERGTDAGYRGSPHPGRNQFMASGGRRAPIVPGLVHPDTLWSCTTCRACVHECPMMIEHVDAVIDLRRFQALEAGAVPGKGAKALEELRLADNPGGRDPATRLDWAADLALRVLAPGDSCDVLLWLGDAAFDLRGQRTLRALVKLLWAAKFDFAVLGAAELDCGDLARRLGDEATFQTLARRVVATLATVRFERIVTADPHALNSLRNDYPAFGGTFNVVHHTALLAELVAAGRIVPSKRPGERITYHDPCYLGRYNGEVEAPRALLRALGAEHVEMERHGLRSLCCGGGGGAPLTDVAGARRIPDLRMDQARATGAGIVAVACPNCAVMLEGVIGARPRVADLAELLAEAIA